MGVSASPSVSPSVSVSPSASPSKSISASPSVSPSVSVSPSMSPSPADLIYPPTQNGLQKTLGAQLDTGETATCTLNNTTGIQNKKGLFVVDRIDTAGTEKDAALREYITFDNVSGSTVTGLTRGLGGTTDQDHALGAIVEFVMDVVQEQALIDTFLVEHGTSGVHNSSIVSTVTGTQTLTNKTLTSPTINTPTITTPTITGAKITPRIVTNTDQPAAAINCDVTDEFVLTAIGNATTFTVTGTPVNGQKLIIRFKDGGVAKGLTWTGFTAIGCTAPTTTVAGKTHYVGCIYNSATPTWNIVAAIVEA